MSATSFRKTLGSVGLAVALIIGLAAVSVLGTLIPQHRPPAEYVARYGGLGRLAGPLGLDRVYQSPLFLGLLLLFAANLAVCTLTRVPAKLRRVFGAKWTADPAALSSWRIHDALTRPGPAEDAVAAAAAGLGRRRYRVFRRAEGPRLLLRGRKNAAGAFGSDIVHLGLLVVIAGGIIGGLGSFKAEVALTEGAVEPVGTRGLDLRLDGFETVYYPNGAVRDWKSEVAVSRAGRILASGTIEVNHPLKAGGVLFYQSGYGRDWDRATLGLRFGKRDEAAPPREMTLRPGETADAGGGIAVSVRRFVPDFVLTAANQVDTRSLELNNPAALVEIRRPDGESDSAWIFGSYRGFGRFTKDWASEFAVELGEVRAPEYSVILAARDPGAPGIWAGSALVVAGLFLCFFLPSREIRIAIDPGRGSSVSIAAAAAVPKGAPAPAAEFTALMADLRRPR